ncbi:unnamed protein product [Sympodiomycopsis kandeliae]
MSAPVRPTRAAARYRPGKAPVAGQYADEYDSDSDDGQQSTARAASPSSSSRPAESIVDFRSKPTTAGVVVNIGSGSFAPREESYDSDEYETDTDEEQEEEQKPAFTRPSGGVNKVKNESESEYETDSDDEEEEESSSSEEEEQKPMFKPIFISRKQRDQGQSPSVAAGATTEQPKKQKSQKKTAEELEREEEEKAIAESQRRKKEAQHLASERIKLELLEKQAQESTENLEVDDTDSLNPEEEFQLWRLRELSRIKRDLESEIEKEKEEEERRKRDLLSESEKLNLDTQKANASRQEKRQQRSENQSGFLQKYYHKGAFFQDLDILKKRDYSGESTESSIDKKNLPSIMQKRDFGKRGQSKWTHLSNEDTSRTGNSSSNTSASFACFNCGSKDHRKSDCPVNAVTGSNRDQLRDRPSWRGDDAFNQHDSKRRRTDHDSHTRDAGWPQKHTTQS